MNFYCVIKLSDINYEDLSRAQVFRWVKAVSETAFSLFQAGQSVFCHDDVFGLFVLSFYSSQKIFVILLIVIICYICYINPICYIVIIIIIMWVK